MSRGRDVIADDAILSSRRNIKQPRVAVFRISGTSAVSLDGIDLKELHAEVAASSVHA